MCSVQNKNYGYKEGLSLVTDIVQEIRGKQCDGQLKISNLQKIPFCPMIYSRAVHVFVPHVSFVTILLFIPFVYRIIMGGMEERGLWISAVNTPCLCLRCFLKWQQQQRKIAVMSKCYRAAKILISLDCCLIKEWEQRQEWFVCWLKSNFIYLLDYLAYYHDFFLKF